MGLEKPYVKRTAAGGEVVPVTDHNKQGDQLEALTVLANRAWTTGARPTPGADDLYPLGFNTTLLVYEFWNGSAWVQIGSPAMDWEHVGTERLTSPASSIPISGLSCGLASGAAKYQALRLWIYLKANGGNVAQPRMYANGDTTDTNYWAQSSINNARIDSGTLTTGGAAVIYQGLLVRANALAGEINAYHFGFQRWSDNAGSSLDNNGSPLGWKWLNPDPDDVLDSLEPTAPTNQFETGSQIRVEGMRPGI